MEKILVVKHRDKEKLTIFLNTLYAVANDQGINVESMRILKERKK